SRLPPPTLPQVRSRPTTILAPASRGACPRTSATVTSTPGWPSSRSCWAAFSQSISHPRVSWHRRLAPGAGIPSTLDGPEDGFRGGRAAEVDAPARRPERGHRLPQRLAHAERLHQRRLADRLGAVDHTGFGGPLEQVHV